MKSRRHELQNLNSKPSQITTSPAKFLPNDLNEITKPKVASAKETQTKTVGLAKYSSHQNSKKTLEHAIFESPNKNLLLSEYSQFLKRSGMVMDNNITSDKLNVRDIDGASPYVKQLSSSKPISTYYDKTITLPNYKTTFLQRRAWAKNYDSKRCMRINDIDGAEPKQTKSITETRRAKLRSSDLRDLLAEMMNYRQKKLDKNGFVEFSPKQKLD